jgi:hypothetical protein
MQATRTRVLFDATAPRKPSRRFGVGVQPSNPAYWAPYSIEDEKDYLEALAAREEAIRDFDQHIEERYMMSLARDRHEAGLLMG